MSKAKATAAKGPRVFVPLTKVDEEQRLVYGVITEEVQDQAGETMHYEKSKANFEAWSAGIEKASGGLSKGNVRVMHQLKVGGKLTDIAFNDDDKSIEVCAKVTDDTEWNNVLEGCYTGFSVGGSYGKKWTENGTKFYEAKPNEVSLVDNPCVKGATFTMVKADGAEELMQWDDEPTDGKLSFHKAAGGEEAEEQPEAEAAEEAPKKDDDKSAIQQQIEKAAAIQAPTYTNDQLAAKCKELQKAANDGRDWMSFMDDARVALEAELQKGDKADAPKEEKDDKKPEAGKPEAGKKKTDDDGDEGDDDDDSDDAKVAKTTPAGVKQQWTTSDGKAFTKKSDAVAHEEQLSKTTQEGDDEATRLSKSIGRIKDLMEKNADAPVEVGDLPEEPSILSFERIEDLHKAFLELELPREEDGSPKLEKGMYTVSRFARMLGDVGDLARTIKAEGTLEGGDRKDSEVAKTLTTQLGSFGDSFMDYAKQQIGELVAGLDTDLTPRACYDYYYRAVEADPENALAKNVCELIEAVEEDRDVAMEKLAKLAPEPVDTEETLQKVADLETENGKLQKMVADVLPTVEALEKRLKLVEDMPMPRAPRGSILEKSADGALHARSAEDTKAAAMSQLEELLKTKTPEEVSLMLIKAAQSNPQKLGLAR